MFVLLLSVCDAVVCIMHEGPSHKATAEIIEQVGAVQVNIASRQDVH
jgi:hypothetical protein